MAFADLASNQMVDENNASTGGFTAIGPKLSPANKCYTKAEALAAYSLSTSAMNGFANNQLVPKSAWQQPSVTSYLYSISSLGVSSAAESCPINDPEPLPVYSTSSVLAVNMVLYYEPQLITPLNGLSSYFKSMDAFVSLRINSSGVVTEIVDCQNFVYYEIPVTNPYFTAGEACGDYGAPLAITLYCSEPFTDNGNILYTNPELTIPYNGQNFYYKTAGTNTISISTTGVISNNLFCPSNYRFNLSISETNALDACSLSDYPNVIFTSSSVLTNGVFVYNDPYLADVFIGGGLYYKEPNDFTSYRIENNGEITDSVNCF